MKRFSEYRAFTSQIYRIIIILVFISLLGVGFFSDQALGFTGAFIVTAFSSTVTIFLDYFIFGGVSARKQRGMELVKSSFKGRELLEKALKTDMYIKAFINLSGFIGFLLAEIVFSEEGLSPLAIILFLILYPITNLTSRIILIIARRFAVSMASQVFITYLASMLNTLLLLTISFLIPLTDEGFNIILIVPVVIIEALSILTATLLLKDCIKGYNSSFYDIV
ncbi:MAG: hypothetical protein IKP88_13880 [Lachnospiraceae bacterium]|nr:hypothetical protein [Lachnospiraceae bacterium]